MKALKLAKQKRNFLPEEFEVDSWENIKPYFEDLRSRQINNLTDFKRWIKDRSELESVLSENLAWRYIRMTCDTANEELTNAFNFYVSEIEPQIAPYANDLNTKALSSPFINDLKKDPGLELFVKLLDKDVRTFREANIPLHTEVSKKEQKFGAIAGAMTVEIDGKELTLQQAADYLKDNDRSLREAAWIKISERRYKDNGKLDGLFNELLNLRNEISLNADFKNFRDYKFVELGRFSYTPEDCFQFHKAVKNEVVPILNDLARQRKTWS